MPKFKYESKNCSLTVVAGIRDALNRIRLAGPKGKALVESVEAGHLQTVFEGSLKNPQFTDKRGAEYVIDVIDAGGGITLPPRHPYAKGGIRVLVNFSALRTYKAMDGSTVKLTRALLIAHELGHCKAHIDRHPSHDPLHGSFAGQDLAIATANPVYVELGAKQRCPDTRLNRRTGHCRAR